MKKRQTSSKENNDNLVHTQTTISVNKVVKSCLVYYFVKVHQKKNPEHSIYITYYCITNLLFFYYITILRVLI